MARFTKFVALAQRLIQKNGRSIVVTFPTNIDQDINAPYLGKIKSGNTKTVIGVFVNQNKNDQGLTTAPILSQSGLKDCLIAAGDISPDTIKTATTITDRSVVWKVKNVETVDPGDDPILFRLKLEA